MVSLYGIFIAGETLNDPSLIDQSLYGPGDSNDNVTVDSWIVSSRTFYMKALSGGWLVYRRSDIFPQCNDDRCRGDVAPRVNLYAYKDAVVKQSFDAALKSHWRSASTCRRRLCQRQLRNKARGAEAGTAPLRSLSRSMEFGCKTEPGYKER